MSDSTKPLPAASIAEPEANAVVQLVFEAKGGYSVTVPDPISCTPLVKYQITSREANAHNDNWISCKTADNGWSANVTVAAGKWTFHVALFIDGVKTSGAQSIDITAVATNEV